MVQHGGNSSILSSALSALRQRQTRILPSRSNDVNGTSLRDYVSLLDHTMASLGVSLLCEAVVSNILATVVASVCLIAINHHIIPVPCAALPSSFACHLPALTDARIFQYDIIACGFPGDVVRGCLRLPLPLPPSSLCHRSWLSLLYRFLRFHKWFPRTCGRHTSL